MVFYRFIAALGFAATLSACSVPDIATRNAPFEPMATPAAPESMPAVAAPKPAGPLQDAAPAVSIAGYSVRVPRELTVSEASLYYPIADIVWRGDPHGNRKAQVMRIFQDGIEAARSTLDGESRVDVALEVTRFHSLTEKTRYSIGGVHSIGFTMTVRDAESGAILIENRTVKADLRGWGGRRALEAEAQGLTMKARITAHLARVIAAELTLNGGWQDFDRRMINAVDAI
jgi:hypothetical protein